MFNHGNEPKVQVELTLNEISTINAALNVWFGIFHGVPGVANGRLTTAARLEARTHMLIQDLEEAIAAKVQEGDR